MKKHYWLMIIVGHRNSMLELEDVSENRRETVESEVPYFRIPILGHISGQTLSEKKDIKTLHCSECEKS
jgi:hypothetical protein